MSHMTVEVFPKAEVLSESAITTTWHVTEDLVEFKVLLLFVDVQIWQKSSVVVDYKQVWGIQSAGLMC